MFGLYIFNLFFSFLHLGPLTLSNFYSIFFSNFIFAYKLIVLCLLCLQVVKDYFTLIYNIYFGSHVLFPENSYLIFIIP